VYLSNRVFSAKSPGTGNVGRQRPPKLYTCRPHYPSIQQYPRLSFHQRQDPKSNYLGSLHGLYLDIRCDTMLQRNPSCRKQLARYLASWKLIMRHLRYELRSRTVLAGTASKTSERQTLCLKNVKTLHIILRKLRRRDNSVCVGWTMLTAGEKKEKEREIVLKRLEI
jgi:hypothetical protein